MDEVLNKILNSDLLNEETKVELKSALESYITEAKEAAIEEAKNEIKLEYATEFAAAKEALVEALDTKTEEFLRKELTELKDDIESFRDLEVEYAEKLVEAKKEMALTLEGDMTKLVDTLDTFLEMRLNEEFTELRESIEEVKKNEFGRRLFEAYKEEFATSYVDKDGAATALKETQEKLDVTKNTLKETTKELATIKRDAEMHRVTESLHGRPREIMEAILKGVPTDKLQEAYDTFIPRVLNESAATKSEKEPVSKDSKVLAEGDDSTAPVVSDTKIMTGDIIVEGDASNTKSRVDETVKARLQRLAGIN